MLARQRHAFILERVNVDGAVRVADLVRDLGVSDMTVRRDLEYLERRGAVERVHGGATAISGTALFEPGFTTKSALRRREKRLEQRLEQRLVRRTGARSTVKRTRLL